MKYLPIILILILNPVPGLAKGGAACGGCAQEITQLLNHAELLLQLEDQLTQAIPDALVTVGIPDDFNDLLVEALKTAESVSYAAEEIEDLFTRQLPEFAEFAEMQADQFTKEKLKERFKKWRENTREQLLETFKRQGKLYENFDGGELAATAARYEDLLGLETRNGLIKANGSQLNAIVRQLHLLRMMLFDSINMQNQLVLRDEDKVAYENRHNDILLGVDLEPDFVYGDERSF